MRKFLLALTCVLIITTPAAAFDREAWESAHRLAEQMLAADEPELALEQYQLALAADPTGNDRGTTYLEQGVAQFQLGLVDDALASVTESYTIAKSLGDQGTDLLISSLNLKQALLRILGRGEELREAELESQQLLRSMESRFWHVDRGARTRTHLPSGVEIPDILGKWQFEDSHAYRADGKDVSVRYVLGSSLLTIYLSMFSDPEDKYFNGAEQQISYAMGPTTVLERGTFTATKPDRKIIGPYVLFHVESPNGNLRRTGLIVKRVGPWLIKMRFTYFDMDAPVVEPALQEAFDTFDWPDAP